MKKVAILQSNYIPWKGYFDLISSVDEFVVYDDMQYTRRDWRNRNKIKTPQGTQWLTVPVLVKGKYHQKICDTHIDGTDWAGLHWRALEQNYRRAPCFQEVASWLQPLYERAAGAKTISDLNLLFMRACCEFLGISTSISKSSDYSLKEGKVERLADLCRQCNATTYLSGPSAKDYIDEEVFHAEGIEVAWFDYSGYPEYPQPWGEFVHQVSILDVLFNCGQDAPQYVKKIKP